MEIPTKGKAAFDENEATHRESTCSIFGCRQNAKIVHICFNGTWMYLVDTDWKYNSMSLTHLPWTTCMAAISQTIFSDASSWLKSFVFWLKFQWSLFLRVQLTIIQHWSSNYLNQCIIAITRPGDKCFKTRRVIVLAISAALVSAVKTHRGRGKMAAIFQTTSSNAFSWIKVYEFRLRFHGSLFLRVQLTIFQNWFR